jgi:hypothetical protein
VADKATAGKSAAGASTPIGTHRLEPPVASDRAQAVLDLQRAAGNRAIRHALGGALLQRKLTIGSSADPQEREADRVADRVSRGAVGGSVVQRRSLCADDERRQGKDAQAPPAEAVRAVQAGFEGLHGGGAPLDAGLRHFYEPRFGQCFDGVRVHNGGEAAKAADALSARAFTVGRDVVFGAGQWAPDSPTGRHLLAHELTHVVQQAPDVVRRKESLPAETPAPVASALEAARSETEGADGGTDAMAAAAADDAGAGDGTGAARAASEPLVEDEAETLEPGQMRKGEFFARLRPAVSAAAEEGFAAIADESRHPPMIELYLGFYERRDVARINRDLPRLAGDGPPPSTAERYVELIAARVHDGVGQWAQNGEITGAPLDAPGMELPAPGELSALGGLAGLGGGGGGMFFKARPGGTQGRGDPAAVRHELGDGAPLDPGVRSRMETAFGTSFRHVRVHADGPAGSLASRFNAHAFTVGEHVAFGDQAYRPGTLAGDALIAHELAHVAQQGPAGAGAAPAHAHGGLEHEADVAAVGAVAGRWGLRGRRRGLAKPGPGWGLGGALRLQRCSGCSSCGREAVAAPPEAAPSRTFADTEVQAYLTLLETTDRVEGGPESHAKARDVIRHWQRGDSLYILPPRRKVVLAQELTQGTRTTDEDQDSLLALLRGATNFEFGQIVGAIGRETLLAKFTEPRRALLTALLNERADASARATREEGLPGETTLEAQREFTLNSGRRHEDEPGEGELRKNCILIVREMAPRLFAENPTLAESVRRTLRGISAIKMTDAGEALTRLGAATGPTRVVFSPGNGNSEPVSIDGSAFDTILGLVGDRQGWHVFGLALFNGFHSVTVFVDRRPDGAQVYWADQWAITNRAGEAEDFGQLAGSASGFRHYDQAGFDGHVLGMTRAWWGQVFRGEHRRKDGTFVPAGTRWEATLKIWEFQFGGTAATPPARP